MRWTTLGYHHDWDTKVYSENMKNKFPQDLADLTKFFATTLGFENYSAEAAIVNYYPIGTTLAGHTDHSEANLDAPLFSFSFGQKAIFLLGGQSKDEKPSAMFLKSGDVVVMSKSSRLCYHAVPRVMSCELEPYNNFNSNEPEEKKCKIVNDCDDENFWTPFRHYLKDSRININIRQVLNKGQLEL
ncbi:ALKBH1 family protein [Megaselia abdita]